MYCFQMKKAIVILKEGSVFCESMRGLVKDSCVCLHARHPVYGGFIVMFDVYGNLDRWSWERIP